MKKIAQDYKALYGSSEIKEYLDNLIDNNEVIDITGCTMTKEIAEILTAYCVRTNNVVGYDPLLLSLQYPRINNVTATFYNNFINDLKRIESSIVNNQGCNIDIAEDASIVKCATILLLMCKHSKLEFTMSNKVALTLYTTIQPLVTDTLYKEQASSYFILDDGLFQVSQPLELIKKYIETGRAVPNWFYGDANCTDKSYLEYINRIKNLIVEHSNTDLKSSLSKISELIK